MEKYSSLEKRATEVRMISKPCVVDATSFSVFFKQFEKLVLQRAAETQSAT